MISFQRRDYREIARCKPKAGSPKPESDPQLPEPGIAPAAAAEPDTHAGTRSPGSA